jgi:hypothetical protein
MALSVIQAQLARMRSCSLEATEYKEARNIFSKQVQVLHHHHQFPHSTNLSTNHIPSHITEKTMTKKIITVFGATGNQGGSVVDIFLRDLKLKDEWKVRGVTRDVSKPSSKKLEERGVEVVAVSFGKGGLHVTCR